MSGGVTYLRFELLRTVRNLRFFFFSLVFPLLLFYLVAGPNKDQHLQGIAFPVYFMAGMVAWGTMAAVMAGGARIAAERSVGWNRQLRLTPLKPWTYFMTKVVSGYAMAAVSIVLLYTAGITLGVHLTAQRWLTMTGLVLVGMIPFAALGIMMGHLFTADSMGPALGGIISLFALLGGSWGPVASSRGWLHQVVTAIPSYWLVQAGRVAVLGGGWPAKAWWVILIWTLVASRLAALAYRRDSKRV